MLSIRQYFLKIIISFVSLITLSSCGTNHDFSAHHKSTPTNIAILLSSSEDDAHMSAEYAKMLKMGLSDGAKTSIKVKTYNYQNQEQLEESINKIFDQGTDIIIGAISSEDASIVSNKTRNKGTILLSMSNNPVLAGDKVFVFGHAPVRQLEQITHYFLNNKHQHYIALLPSGKYSDNISAILQDILENKDARLSHVKFYTDSEEDIARSVHAVSNAVDRINENDFNLKQPVILIADDKEPLKILYKNLKEHNLDKRAIIAGDGSIDIDSFVPLDIIFTGSSQIDNNMLLRSVNLDINHISFMHAISYDLGKMTSQYIGQSYDKEKFLSRLNSESFIGMSGKIAFVDSIAQREYDIIKKENGSYVVQNQLISTNPK